MNRRLQTPEDRAVRTSRALAGVLRVLLVEDSEQDAELMLRALKRAAIECESRRVQTEADFGRELKAFRPHVILSDFSIPGFSGMTALGMWKRSGLDLPFIFVSGTIGEDIAIEAMKAGAHDYVMKTNLARLAPAVQRELREAEVRRASHAAEAGLRRAQQMARLAHVITAPDGSFETWSETLPPLIGVAPAQMPASTRQWLDLLHPDDRPIFRAAALEAGSQHERRDLEYRLRRPDGTWVHIRQTMEPLDGERDAKGRSRWFNTLQDVSERKRAEEALQRFRLALDNSADMIVIIDRSSMSFVDVNQSACRLLGYTREELLRMGPQDILPVGREELEKTYDELISNPALAGGMNSYYRCKDGSRLPFESTRCALRSGDHRFVVAISRDIRERLATEQALHESATLKGAILASSLDALVSIDHEGRIIEFNPAAEAVFGLAREQALGKPIAETIIPPRYREAHRRGFAHYRATGEGPVLGKRIEITALRADGTEFPVELAITPIKAGATPLFTAFIRDITARKQADTKIRRLNRVYAVLSAINSLIVRARNREELYRESCRIAVEAGELRLAWIGVVDPKKEEIVPAAFSGVEEGWLGIIRLSTKEDSGRFGMAGRALRDRRPIVSNDLLGDEHALFRKESAERGYRSLAMIPLIVEGEAFGVLGLHAAEVGFFDQEEMKLLLELAGDIAFGLKSIEQEERVRHLTRVHAMLSGINALIVRARDREELYRGSCRIAVEAGKLRLAWIGIVDPKKEEIVPTAFSGREDGLLGAIRLSTRENSGRFGMAGRAIRDGVPAVSNDVLVDQGTRVRGESARRGFRSLAMIPLIEDGAAFGVLGLHAVEAGFFNQEELALLTQLAGDIAFGLKHIEQEEKVGHLTRVQAVLSGINALIVRVRDRSELFRGACRIAVEAGKFPQAAISLLDPHTQEVTIAAWHGGGDDYFSTLRYYAGPDAPEGGSPGVDVLRSQRPWVCNDVEAEGHRLLLRARSLERGLRSVAMLPLVVGGKSVGLFALYAVEPGFFDEEEVKLLMELGGDIAFGIDHIEQEEKVRHLTRVQAVLSGINALIVRVRDRDELFREACRIAVEAGKFAKAWIGIIERDSQALKLVAGYGAEARFFENLGAMLNKDAAAGQGVVAHAVRERQPVISNDLEHDPRVLGKENAAATGSRSLVVLPLVVAEEVTGVLVLHADVPGFFDDAEMRLLLELAGDIAFAIEHIAKSEKLDYLAYYDALTGLANRTLFLERIEQQVAAARHAQQKLAVFLLDIERFKAINDAFGRQAGDQLLKQLSERMLRTGVDPARLARIGADHFGVIGVDTKSVEQVARLTESRLKELFDQPFAIADSELRVSAKVGIALFPDDGADAESLFRNAEAALKKAKAGGERYFFHTEELTARVAERLSLENKMRQALEREEFVLHYQPKVELASGKVVGVEALIRWQSPELGLVPPVRFIPLLEQTGLILQVGTWALKRASHEHRAWTERKLNPPRVAVNVSPIQLRRGDFVSVVEQAIMDGVAPVGIDLEITESLLMDDVQGNIAKLKAVRALGINIAIDDFGTGYSSLGYLAQLPVQSLKIDRSFIIKMGEDPNAMTLVSTIISLAHSLRLKVVAEGVETEEQAKFLRLLRCDELQGYLFSKPVPADELVKLLEKKL